MNRHPVASLPFVVLLVVGCGPADAPPGGTAAARRAPPAGPDLFQDVTAAVGITFRHRIPDGHLSNLVEGLGSGGAFVDLDGDGWLDLVLLNSGPHPDLSPSDEDRSAFAPGVYRNRGDGTFEDVTARTGLHAGDFSIALCAADYDNDGDQDLYVTNAGANRLYRNRGDGRFDEVAAAAGVADPGLGAAAVWFDHDRDGWLDLYVGNYVKFDPDYSLHYDPDVFPGPIAFPADPSHLYRNRGDGTFVDVSGQSGVAALEGRDMSVVAADLDRDGYDDLFVAVDATENRLLRGHADGRFRESAVECGVAYGLNGEMTAAMAGDVADIDGDGLLDLAVSDIGFGGLYLSTPDGAFRDEVMTSGLAAVFGHYVGWGQCLVDVDDDGDPDVFRVNGDLHHVLGWEDLLVRNDGGGRFTDVSASAGAYFARRECSRGACAGDYDNDGDVDLLVTCLDGAPVLLRNDSPPGAHWLTLDLEGTRSNRDGFGARVEAEVGGRRLVAVARCPTGYLSAGDRRVHLGLGPHPVVERLRILWPSGQEQVLEQVAADQVLAVREPGEGRGKP